MSEKRRDIWAEWLAERRFGGDAEVRRQILERLQEVRDKLLESADFGEGETLLDVGCGEGLIGFGALERGAERVLFADISDDLLAACRAAADGLGVSGRCHFLQAPADDLSGVPSETVDVVATRAVLIFVAEKRRAFEEFFRVLRPGGRVAVFEPINRFAQQNDDSTRFWSYPGDGLGDLAEKIHAVYEAIQPPDDPMLDFDERDLLRLAEETGFFPVELELQAEVRATEPQDFAAFLNASGNPRIPTFAEAMEQALTSEEREQVMNHLRPLVKNGQGVWRMALARLTAVKPGP